MTGKKHSKFKLTFIVVLLLTLSSCNNFNSDYKETEISLANFKELNYYLLTIYKDRKLRPDFTPGYDIMTFFTRDSLLKNEELNSNAKDLFEQKKLEVITVHRPNLIQYKIKQVKKEPFFGIGLNYLTFSLFYADISESKDQIIKETIVGGEEKIIWTKSFDDNWTYVVSEHFSD
ncbi:MAG: hypothetical protein LBQ22_11575 [Bacteroidales bacterium]|jgi:hypothetical protein|nr:hypothetical protein [Bacteroidales bacterium]